MSTDLNHTINPATLAELSGIAEVAGFLWQRNWAEANGGNISVNLTHLQEPALNDFPESAQTHALAMSFPNLAGNLIYITGAGTRMREVAGSPLDFGILLRISSDGKRYEIVSETTIRPSSELPAHLSIHNFLKESCNNRSAVLHTHPTELIALTHCPYFLDSKRLTQLLWSMIPETRVLVHKGVGIVPYALTGTIALAKATLKQLKKHDVALWEKHGALAVGSDIMHCFDLIDTLTKSAKIYLTARAARFEPQGLTQDQMNELAKAFGLPVNGE